MKKLFLVLMLTLATALLLFASAEESRRAETREFLKEVRASASVPRREKRVLCHVREGQPVEMTFDITRDGTRSRAKMAGMKVNGADPWENRRDKGFGPPPERPDWKRSDGDRPEWKHGERGTRPARPVPGDFEIDPDRAAANYTIGVKPGLPVAERETDEATFAPRGGDRPSMRLTVDRSKRFILKMELRPIGGDWSLLFETTSIDLSPVEAMTPSTASVEKAEARIVPLNLPTGFEHAATTQFDFYGSKGQESKYTDGLATIRIVVSDKQPWWPKTDQKTEAAAVPVARHRLGPNAEYGLQIEGLYVTVMGGLADETMAKILASLTKR
jgi:hypothetical protein